MHCRESTAKAQRMLHLLHSWLKVVKRALAPRLHSASQAKCHGSLRTLHPLPRLVPGAAASRNSRRAALTLPSHPAHPQHARPGVQGGAGRA